MTAISIYSNDFSYSLYNEKGSTIVTIYTSHFLKNKLIKLMDLQINYFQHQYYYKSVKTVKQIILLKYFIIPVLERKVDKFQ